MSENVTRTYGVKLVRGPFLKLDAHPGACDTGDELVRYVDSLRHEQPGLRIAADLFSGAGGLSLGLERAGFPSVLAVDHYPEAVETHRHHFGGMTVDWDLSEPERIEELADLLTRLQVDVIAGGPPCQPFSKAGRSGIRHRVQNRLRDPHDQRRDLWRSFMEVIRLVRPPAVLMENVPDMALDREMFILRAMVEELEQLGYAVEERVVDSWRYGVPQFRQRLILVALRDGVAFAWPEEAEQMSTVWNAIGEMPEVEGGFRHAKGASGAHSYPGALTAFQRSMRAGMRPGEEGLLFDHITRPVREDDREAFELMGRETRYSRAARGVQALPGRHLRRQVQAAGRGRPVPDHHRAHREGRLLVHPPSSRAALSPFVKQRGCRRSPTSTASPDRRPPHSSRSATLFHLC